MTRLRVPYIVVTAVCLTLGLLIPGQFDQNGAEEKEYSLYIGYSLPRGEDIAPKAADLESACLGRRAFCNQGCKDAEECRDACEHAFRRCIKGIPGAEFYLGWCSKGNCQGVTALREPLADGEESNPRLDRRFHQTRTSRYHKTGIYFTIRTSLFLYDPVAREVKRIEAEKCVFRSEDDGGELNIGLRLHERLCKAINDRMPHRDE